MANMFHPREGIQVFEFTKYVNKNVRSRILVVGLKWVQSWKSTLCPKFEPCDHDFTQKFLWIFIYLPIIERIIPFQFLYTSNNQLDPTISMPIFNIGTIIIPTTLLLLYQAIHTRNCEAQFSSSIFSHAIAITINIPSQSQHPTFEDQ
jgi:hypothetical protein